MESYDMTLLTPSKWIIFGSSGSGKTSFVLKLLEFQNEMFNKTFDRIIYFYGQTEPDVKFHNLKNIEIINGLNIDEDYLNSFDKNLNNVIILDDLMNEIGNDKVIANLFSKFSRHRNITVFLLLQNIFPKGKFFTDFFRNANYLVLMKNPLGMSQIRLLETRIFGNNSNFLKDAYIDSTKEDPFSYLLIDSIQTTPENLRVRTKIFPDDNNHIIYVQKNLK
jgi:hypothetical protein